MTTYRWNLHKPLRLHLHDNQKKAIEAYLVGIRADERVDTLLAPLAWPRVPRELKISWLLSRMRHTILRST